MAIIGPGDEPIIDIIGVDALIELRCKGYRVLQMGGRPVPGPVLIEDPCPIGLDNSPTLCSAGVCGICRQWREFIDATRMSTTPVAYLVTGPGGPRVFLDFKEAEDFTYAERGRVWQHLYCYEETMRTLRGEEGEEHLPQEDFRDGADQITD